MSTRTRRKTQKEDENVSFVKSLEFRANRGNKIKTLLEKKENEDDSDDFWKNNKYFGSFNDVMNESEESEEYSQEADIPDEFDEDFSETSESEEEEGEDESKGGKKNKDRSGFAQTLHITQKAQPDVKKFIEKDEKKKVKPAIAALKKSKTKAKAKAEAEAQVQAQAKAEAKNKIKSKDEMEIEPAKPVVSTQSTRPRRELRNVTFAMDTPEKPEKLVQAEKTQKIEKSETIQKETTTVIFIVKAAGKKNPEKKVTVQAIMPKKPSLKKKADNKTPPKKQTVLTFPPQNAMQIESDTNSQARTTRGQEKRAIEATERGTIKAPKPKIKPTKNAKTILKAKAQNAAVETPKKKGKYIHDFYTQEELMKEAALTEIYNKKSLESLLQLETDKKDSYLVVRRFKIDEPKVTFISKKVNDMEETKLILSNKEAYQNYFNQILHPPSTSLKKRPLLIQELDDSQETDQAEIIRKKLFLTNAQYKLAEIHRNIQKMEDEETRIDKTIKVLRDILEKKQEALDF